MKTDQRTDNFHLYNKNKYKFKSLISKGHKMIDKLILIKYYSNLEFSLHFVHL